MDVVIDFCNEQELVLLLLPGTGLLLDLVKWRTGYCQIVSYPGDSINPRSQDVLCPVIGRTS